MLDDEAEFHRLLTSVGVGWPAMLAWLNNGACDPYFDAAGFFEVLTDHHKPAAEWLTDWASRVVT